jgi:hypothetical protein
MCRFREVKSWLEVYEVDGGWKCPIVSFSLSREDLKI